MAPSSPEGILLGPLSKPWRVGRELGRGACGSVHIIEASSRGGAAKGDMSYVVKIAPIPPSSSSSAAGGGAAKKKKRKKTALERNADLLYHENTLYRNVLNDMRGAMVPEVPHAGEGGPPGYGDVEGYRFLCMERMDAPLSAVVPALLAEATKSKRGSSSKTSSPTIALGDVAATMIGLVEALHSRRLLFVDVKAENFMLASSSASSSSGGKRSAKKGGSATGLCSRLRMIDFGLVESFRDVTSGGHREDMHPNSSFVGTPEYASLNVLRGHTPSRRDDLEAVGYVLAEMVLSAVALGSDSGSSSSSSSKERKGSKKSSSGAFPWSSCKSDDEVLRVKAEEVEGKGRSGSFFALMGAGGNANSEKAMRKYFTAVRNLGYSEKPDYDKLKSIVVALKVVMSGGGGTDEEEDKKPAAASKGRRKRSTRSSAAARAQPTTRQSADNDVEYDEDVAPTKTKPRKRRGRTTRNSAARASPVDVDMEDVVEIDDSDDEDEDDDFHTCNSDEMDWEFVRDENEAPPAAAAASTSAAAAASSSSSAKKKAGALQVLVIDGPHKGESFGLGGDSADVITVGRGPSKPRSSASSSADIYKLGRDGDASTSHVKLALYSAKGGSHSVRVTDLKATNGTFVNGKEIPTGKYKQAFIGDKIQVGGSTLQIKRGA